MNEDREDSPRARWPGAHLACLELGSNISPEDYLPKAVTMLHLLGDVEAVSTAWESPAVGSCGPDYLNAALLIRTRFSREELKVQLKQLEDDLGRARTGNTTTPLTIDIDLLIFDGEVLEPNLWDQAYLSVPVAELLPDLVSPKGGETLAQAARRLARTTPIRPRPEVLPGWPAAGRLAALGDRAGDKVTTLVDHSGLGLPHPPQSIRTQPPWPT